MKSGTVWGAVFVLAALAAAALGQEARVSIEPRTGAARVEEARTRTSALRVDVRLVLVPVLVTDLYQRPVLGLKKENFRLWEDGTEQEITQFYQQENPASVGIVFDASGSMAPRMNESRKAVSKFLRMSNPEDEFFVIRFSDGVERVQGFTRDIGLVEKSMEGIVPDGWTALFDAVHLAMNDMRRARHQRKALLIVSDGGDNMSRYGWSEILSRVQEGDVRIFAVSLVEQSAALRKLAEQSGGRAFRVKRLEELEDLIPVLSAQLHTEYVLGYQPKVRPADGKYRKVRVEMAPAGDGRGPLSTSWRQGYYGPAE